MSSPISFPELYKAGFDDFIIPSYETAPFTTIQNRAKVTRSLKAIAGVERIQVRGLNRLQNEFGPNGEQVWEADNKDSRIRFVGTVSNLSNASGSQVVLSQNAFAEVTFYGTGINFLYKVDNAGRDLKQAIDGGAETDVSEMGSTILAARNYNTNQVINLYSGLTLGWHTLKLRNNTANDDYIYGFEILNERSNLAVYQGSGIAQGALNGLSSLTTSSFTDGVTGTRGARVVKYIDNGTLKSAVQAVDASAAYLTAASHTNEEVVRRINFREFGANRADDFSTLPVTANQNRAFTLDDGTTTLVGSNVENQTTNDTIRPSTTNSFITITFVGTGIDLVADQDAATAFASSPILLDGVSIGDHTAFTPDASAGVLRTYKIASGLPYGTHTLRYTRPATGNFLRIRDFIIYQPKKPSIPAGAFEVADYNVMASFSPIASAGILNIAQGVLRKVTAVREMVPTGTWTAPVLNTSFVSGFDTKVSAATGAMIYSFYGTGFDWRTNNNNAVAFSITMSVNGSTNLSGFTVATQLSAGTTFNSATGVYSGTSAAGIQGASISVRGLALGWHTVQISIAGTGQMYSDCFDIITPIHINQPSLKTGSLSLKSATKYSPEKVISNAGPDLSKAKAWALLDGANSRILASYNISSALFGSAPTYLYFEKPFKTDNYVVVGTTVGAFTFNQFAADSRKRNYVTISAWRNDTGYQTSGAYYVVCFGELIDE